MKIKKYTKKFPILKNKILLIVLGFFIVVGFFSFRSISLKLFSTKQVVQNQLSVIYSGILPCADCSGMVTTLKFEKNTPTDTSGTYVLKQVYQGKNVTYEETGRWLLEGKTLLEKQVNVYFLIADKTNAVQYYLIVDDSHIQLLDTQGNIIDTPFNSTLTKVQ